MCTRARASSWFCGEWGGLAAGGYEEREGGRDGGVGVLTQARREVRSERISAICISLGCGLRRASGEERVGVNVLIEGSFGRDLPRIGASTLLNVLQMPGIADATVYESSFASVGYITSPYIL